MLEKIIRYFKGYLRIRVSGNTVERFINTCSHKGIFLWDLTASHLQYEMNITVKDFKKLKPVIRKTGTKTIIVNRTGFPFFLRKYQHRKIFFSGFILCFFLISMLSNHIWKIDIKGNYSYTYENIKEFLSTIDVTTGMKRQDVDCAEIARALRNNYNDIIWVSASLEGSRLMIQIKENMDASDTSSTESNISAEKVPYDLVASKDCLITKIVVRNGITSVKEGDYVKQGDILVSGNIPILNDAKEIISYQCCIADADIYGKIKLSYNDEIKRAYKDKKELNIHKTEYFLHAWNFRLRFGSIKNNYEHFTEYSKQNTFYGIRFGVRTVSPYQTQNKNYSTEQLREMLSRNFKYYCKELEKKGVVILENDVKIYTWSDTAKASGTITVEMPVGQLNKSKLIEIGEHIDGNDGNNN